MIKWPHQTYCMIIGFVLGSTLEIFREKILPAIPAGATYTWWIPSFMIAIVVFVLGYISIQSLSKFSDD